MHYKRILRRKRKLEKEDAENNLSVQQDISISQGVPPW